MSARRVLVVEDDELVRVVLERIVVALDLDPVLVENGTDGLAALEQSRFDMVVTDLRMPGASGLDIARWIAAQVPAIPTVVVSGYASEDEEDTITALGAHLLRKPFSASDARALFARVLGAME